MAFSPVADPRIWAHFARLERADGPFATLEAAEALIDALDRFAPPDRAPLALFARGRAVSALIELGKFGPALELAEAAIAESDEDEATQASAQLAVLVHHRAHCLIALGRPVEAIKILERLDRDFADDADEDVRETLAVALRQRADALEEQGEPGSASALREQIVRRYRADGRPGIRKVVSAALVEAAEHLRGEGELGRALMALDEAIRRGRADPGGPDPAETVSGAGPRELAVRALYLRAGILDELDRFEDGLAALQDAIDLAAGAVTPIRSIVVAAAQSRLASLFIERGRTDEAAAAWAELERGYADHPEPFVRCRVVDAIRERARIAGDSEDRAAALDLLRSAIRRFAWDDDRRVQAAVGLAVGELAGLLHAAGEHRAAVDAWDDRIAQLDRLHPGYSAAPPEARRARAAALLGIAREYRHIALPGWAIETLDNLAEQCADDADPDVAAVLAEAQAYRAQTQEAYEAAVEAHAGEADASEVDPAGAAGGLSAGYLDWLLAADPRTFESMGEP